MGQEGDRASSFGFEPNAPRLDRQGPHTVETDPWPRGCLSSRMINVCSAVM